MLVNLTSHDIVVRTPDGDIIIKPSGEVARVASEQEVIARHAEVEEVDTTIVRMRGTLAERKYVIKASEVLPN